MNGKLTVAMAVAAVMFWGGQVRGESAHGFGFGVHYLRTVDSIDIDDVDDAGVAYVVSYQYAPTEILRAELNVEIFPDDWLGSSEDIYAPQAFLIVGSGIYAGVGVGAYYSDGDFGDDTFYVLRAGLNMDLLPSISLDINLNYQFSEYEGLDPIREDIDTDTVTLGAAVRISL